MGKKTLKKATKPLATKPGGGRSGRASQANCRATTVAEAPLPPAPPKVKVTFLLPFCDASRVSLSGEFNGWSPQATPMQRYADGHWETTLELAPGRYEYKFVRDGEWMPDLLARENVLNGYGTLNSVIEVRAS